MQSPTIENKNREYPGSHSSKLACSGQGQLSRSFELVLSGSFPTPIRPEVGLPVQRAPS